MEIDALGSRCVSFPTFLNKSITSEKVRVAPLHQSSMKLFLITINTAKETMKPILRSPLSMLLFSQNHGLHWMGRFLFVLVIAGNVHAATDTWTGATDGNWMTANNWG